MAKLIQHATQEPAEAQFLRDADHDAFETLFTIPEADRPYTFRNPLGRLIRRVEIVWKEGYCDWKPVFDAKSQPIADLEKIILQFSAATRIKLRFS